ncbi:OLC1v1029848C1 [Oldenlandia corymbosa var. corymbosa]|nr:OLC1v1029848C1 [Oldenlandia corymbosa var. corymbosa]
MKTVSSLEGIDSLNMDKDWKLTVTGDFDPVKVVSKLRKKKWNVEIITVGPAKEPENKKKEDENKKKEDENKKKEEEKKKKEDEITAELLKNYKDYYAKYLAQAHQHYYVPPTGYYTPYKAQDQYSNYHLSQEENPNSCVIS